METERGTLRVILEGMDVPAMRLQLRPEDLRWLQRNLAINNSEDARFDEALSIIKKLSAGR